MFITFEGPEGCGKSTQAKRLYDYLISRGTNVLLSQEPGGTVVGKTIRQLLLDPANRFDSTTEVFLFAADRSEHVAQIIMPALKENKIVICDRYIDSTIAYQVSGSGLPEDMVRYVNMIAARGLIPDLTIMLDVSPAVGLKRASSKGVSDRFEKEQLDFHNRVRQAYLEIAAENPQRVKLLNTENSGIEEIAAQIREIVDEKLGD